MLIYLMLGSSRRLDQLDATMNGYTADERSLRFSNSDVNAASLRCIVDDPKMAGSIAAGTLGMGGGGTSVGMAAEIGRCCSGAATVAAAVATGGAGVGCRWRSCRDRNSGGNGSRERQHRLRQVRLAQRRQARQWAVSLPLLCQR